MYRISFQVIKYFITGVCVWVSMFAAGQNQNNQWRFGSGGAINFNVSPPVSVGGSVIQASEGSASIADRRTGQLLFYTDGVTVWDATNTPMPNGTGLRGGATLSSTSAAVIVPKPLSTDLYFLFTIDEQFGGGGLRYSIVDMTLNNGRGDIQPGQKNIALFTTNSEKLCAVPKADGCGYWVITHDNPGNSFYAFEVNSAGVQTVPVVSTAGVSQSNGAGYMKINRQFNKLAMGYLLTAAVELFDFDNATGIVSNPISWPTNGAPGNVIYGCEFSPNGSKLYVSNLQQVFQFNISLATPAAIAASRYVVSQGETIFYSPAALQLGPDNKVYIAAGRIDAINFPDSAGAACGFQTQAIELAPGTGSTYGLPQWVYQLDGSAFNNAINVADTCSNQTASFTIQNATGATAINWNFGDPASGAQNTATGITATHQFSQAGQFAVRAVLIYPCFSDTVLRVMNVVNCSSNNITGIKISGDTCNAANTLFFQATGQSSAPVFSWNFGDPASGANNTAVVAGGSAIPFPGHQFSAPGIYNVCVSFQEPGEAIATVCRTFRIGLCCTGSATSSTTPLVICPNQLPFSWNNNNYSSPGTYQVTLVNSSGCDSLAQLVLSVSRRDTTITSLSRCSNQLPFNWNGNALTTSGTYFATLQNINGCDSVLRLNFTVQNTGSSDSTAKLCSNQLPIVWNGQSIATAGVYTANLNTAGGCDSVATLRVQVVNTRSDTTTVQRCAAQLPYSWNGQSISASGIYQAALPSFSGCDSIEVLRFTVLQSSSSDTTIAICSQQLPFRWNNVSYNAAGSYQAAFVNAAGCDSIARLRLFISDTLRSTTTIRRCAAQLPYRFNGVDYSLPGTYAVELTSVAGCDSIATLQLQLGNDPVINFPASDTTVCAGTGFLLSPGSFASYRWQDGATAATYSVSQPGSYQVTVTNSDGCTATASVRINIADDCQSIYFPSAISTAPGSTNNNFGALGNLSLVKNYTLSVYNRFGQLVFTSNDPRVKWNGRYKNALQANASFVWQARYSINNREEIRKGTLVVLR